jgi:hypothetical protein
MRFLFLAGVALLLVGCVGYEGPSRPFIGTLETSFGAATGLSSAYKTSEESPMQAKITPNEQTDVISTLTVDPLTGRFTFTGPGAVWWGMAKFCEAAPNSYICGPNMPRAAGIPPLLPGVLVPGQ